MRDRLKGDSIPVSAQNTQTNTVAASNRRIQLSVLLLGALVTMFNISVTNVALPTIATALDASGMQIHMIADGFTIALTAFVLIAGVVGDRYGRKRLFLAGTGVMIPASLFSALSSSANELILWRMVAGLATALLFPTTLSMVTMIFRDPMERVRAIALWSGTAAAGSAIAPVVAGTLIEFFNWNSVFLCSLLIAMIAFVVGWRFLPSRAQVDVSPVDWLGGALSVVFIGALLFAIIVFPVEGLSQSVIVMIVIALIGLAAFLFRQKHARHPLLDLSVFRDMRFTIASITLVLVAFAMLGVMFLAAQYVQNVLGYPPLVAGLSVLPLSIAGLIASPLSARLDIRYGSKLVVASGLVFIGLGFMAALFWTVSSPYIQVFLSYVLIGTGMGLAMTPTTNAIMGSLPPEKAGVGSAMNDVTRDFGSALGIAINGSIAALTYSGTLAKLYNHLTPEQQAEIPDNVARTIAGSLSGALKVAQRYPGPDADKMIQAARQAFLDGQIAAMLLSAILCFAGAVIVWVLFPARAEKFAPVREKEAPTTG